MRTRYQYHTVDLWALLSVWAPSIAGSYLLVMKAAPDALILMIMLAVFLSITVLGGWILGLRIANGFALNPGLKRLGIFLLCWLCMLAVVLALVGLVFSLSLLSQRQPNEGMLGISFIGFSALVFWYTVKIERMADASWEQRHPSEDLES
jgi:hypothetical protein